ncbi:type IV pilin protein [Candidatus Avelusimicrobium sp.]|uniref:type IV pilin protein n=1 Tax=Candidatus Avelusimicrobium sp. TaxID=3048833 RepID=UPI003D7F0344
MKSNKKRKAFTLTELLVVVIVIGILSAVVLPKFSKVIETRKTTEAEEMMAAVRTEQEKRCALDKNYTTDAEMVNLASLNTKNFNYTLKNTGMEAASKGKYGYTLKMPSYRDGRLCCDSAEQCAKLNKNYPLCSELIAKADYTSGAECAAGGDDGPKVIPCSGSATQACGCKNGGTQTRTCDTTTGTWSAWGDCSIADTCECTGKKPSTSETCNKCGTRKRTVTCDATTGEWKKGDWGSCSKTSSSQCSTPSGPTPGPTPDPCPEDLRAYCTNLGQDAYECGACASCDTGSGGSECGGSECGGSESGGSGSGGSDCGGLGDGDDMNCVLCTNTADLTDSVVCSIDSDGKHVDGSCSPIEGSGGYHCTVKPHACTK